MLSVVPCHVLFFEGKDAERNAVFKNSYGKTWGLKGDGRVTMTVA